MKKKATPAGISLSLLFVLLGNAQQGDSPVLKGPYLGQKTPGMTPELFARGIVSTDRIEFGNTFSPDGREFYFTRFADENKLATILFVKTANDRWVNPHVAPFSGNYSDVDPAFSHDGRQLYFSSNRPLKGAGEPKEDYDIWVVNRTESGWSEPVNPGFSVNSEKDEFAPSVAQNGTIYFASNRQGGWGQMDFYCSVWLEGKFGKPENLGAAINTKYREGDGFISPDGSFFLFSAFVPGNLGSGDLYISYKGKNGQWTRARSLGSGINSAGNEFTPAVTADGKYLFFASDRTGNDDIYWVDMESVDKTAADHFIVQKATLKKDISGALPRLFIMGGFKEKETFSDVCSMSISDLINGENKGWNRGSSLPKALQGHAAVAVNHHVFVMGGLEGFTANRRAVYSPDVFSAEIKGSGFGDWGATTPLPLPLVHSGVAAHNGRIYVFGGQDMEDHLHAEVYSAAAIGSRLGNWRKETPFPVPQSRMTVHVSNEQVIVTGGGFGWAPPIYSAVFVSEIGADGRLGKWRKIGDLPRPCAFHAAVIVPERR